MPVESISGRGRTSRREAGRTSANHSEPEMCFRTLARFSSTFAKLDGKNAGCPALHGREDIADLGRKLAGAAETRVVSLFIRL
jgi:hypothetical protein